MTNCKKLHPEIQFRKSGWNLETWAGSEAGPPMCFVLGTPAGEMHLRKVGMHLSEGAIWEHSSFILLPRHFKCLLCPCWDKAHRENPGPGTPGPSSLLACSSPCFPRAPPPHVRGAYLDLIKRSAWFRLLSEANCASFISSILAINESLYTQMAVCFSSK